MDNIWNHIAALNPSLGEICLRLGIAMLVGLVIGTEREYTHRPAGMRTHILVALGACVVAITGEALFYRYNLLGATPDPARLSAQVITGVGFLGAGTIMREGASVKGLTTAASLWAVACLGLAAGSGYYALALLGMVFIFLTLTLFELIQKRLMRQRTDRRSFTMETRDVASALNAIHRVAEECHVEIENLDVTNLETGYQIHFRGECHGRRSKNHFESFAEKLAAEPCFVHFKQTSAV